MIDAKAMRARLRALRHTFDADEIDAVCAEIERSETGLAFVPDLFAIMEAHPHEDFGTPGEIVHTIERYYRRGYERHLLDSLRRKPVPHTVWMLNRLVNGTQDDEQLACLALLEQIARDDKAHPEVRERAKGFLAFQAGQA